MRKLHSDLLYRLVAVSCISIAICLGQNSDASNPDNTESKKSPELTALEEYNNLIKAQIDVITNQQKLAGLYFPTVPTRPEPNMTREGAPLLKGNAAAYRKLEQIAALMAVEVAGGQGQPQPVTEKAACESQTVKKKRKQCQEWAREFLTKYDLHERGSKTIGNGSRDIPASSTVRPAIWLQGQKDVADLMEFQGTRFQIELLSEKLSKALKANLPEKTVSSESGGGFPALAAVGPAIQFANGLFNFFRKKVTISSISAETNDVGLASMVAAELRRQGYEMVYFNANYPPRLKREAKGSAILEAVKGIREQLEDVDKKIAVAGKSKTDAQTTARKHAESVSAASAKVNSLDGEIKHLEALQKAAQGATFESLGKLLDSKRKEKIEADADLGKARIANSAADGAIKKAESEIELWTELRKSVEKAIAPFGEEPDSAQFLAKLFRVEGQFDKIQRGDQILQIQVQVAGAEVQRSDRAGNVTETSQGGAIVSFLLMDALNGTIQKSQTFIMAPEGN